MGVFPDGKAGEIAENFTVRNQDGNEVSLEQYRGKRVVLKTGSITCSMYVKNIGGIKKLQAKYHDVEFLLIYVREAHLDARLGPHENDQQKLEMAEKQREFYGESRKIWVDDLDGEMHKALGELPNMVYVINPDGKVIYRCNWAFSKNIDKVLANRDTLHTKEYMAIITAAPWIMIPVILRGG